MQDIDYLKLKDNLKQLCSDFDIDNKGMIPLVNFLTISKKQGIILDNIAGSKNGTLAVANLCDKRGRINYRKLIDSLEYKSNGRWILAPTYVPFNVESNTNNIDSEIKQTYESKNLDTQNYHVETEEEPLPFNSNMDNKDENRVLPPTHPSSIQLKKIPKDIQKLSRMLRKDSFNKENLHMLRTFFCSCQFTEEGIAAASEYEFIINKSNASLSKPTLDIIIKMITIPSDKTKISYFKLKELIKNLEEDQIHIDLHNSSQIKQVFSRSPEPVKKAEKSERDEIVLLKETGSKPTEENERIESYLNQIELRLEEKFINIGHAFRSLDSDGDSRISFDEFWLGLDKIGIIMEKSTCKELFDYMDKNKNSYLEFNEFCDSFDSFKVSKGDFNKLSRIETQNMILESIRKEQGGIKPICPVKFPPTNLFGIANSGISNPIKNKLGKRTVFSPIRHSSEIFKYKNNDDQHDLMNDMLSSISSAKELKTRNTQERVNSQFKFPIPKNKNIEQFINDVSSVNSFDRDRNKDFLPSNLDKQYTYGTRKDKHQNITRLLHHNYLSQFAEETKEKTEKFKQENIELARKSHDWK